jgi:hypothetical protein
MVARTSISLAAALFCATAWSARAQSHFDVKPGQWETTVAGQTTGQLPIPQEMLDKMTPEQRAKIEAAMQARNGQPTVHKSCAKKEDLDKPFARDFHSASCKQTFVTSTSTKQEIHMECEENGGKQVGTLKIEAVDSGTVKGTMQMTATNGARTMNLNYTYSAKWLGPVCAEASK